MPPRNLNIILLAFCVSALCYLTYRRARTAMMVGDALEMINSYYVDPVDDDKLLIAAMEGMTSTLDEHSEYIPGADYQSFQDSINQEFAGIGILVEQPEPGQPVRVITPLVGSPALIAGMLPGDRIIRVDGEDVSKLELRDVSDRLKGPVGTSVRLLVRRDKEDVPLAVNRATIELESVIGDHRDRDNRWIYRLSEDPTIAYIRLTSFGEKTVQELRDVLAALDNDFRGLVLDLRGNSGGLLYAAVDVCNMLIDSGRIVSTRIRGGKIEEVFDAEPGTLVSESKPLAILIDGNSASASEIVAACLQDHHRAVIVGTRSYGKGTVQNILPLQYGRSALRLTVARYYRPSDKNIHRSKGASDDDDWGVKPDDGFEVSLDEETLEKMFRRWREASYPMLAVRAAVDESSDHVEPSTPPPPVGPALKVDPAVDVDAAPAADEDSALSLDPQLRRAVEYLRRQIEVSAPAAAAA